MKGVPESRFSAGPRPGAPGKRWSNSPRRCFVSFLILTPTIRGLCCSSEWSLRVHDRWGKRVLQMPFRRRRGTVFYDECVFFETCSARPESRSFSIAKVNYGVIRDSPLAEFVAESGELMIR